MMMDMMKCMNHLIRVNLEIVDNPGLGYCGIFAQNLIIAKNEFDRKLEDFKGDAEAEGKSSYKTRLSLRGNPGDHCETCAEAMQYLIAKAVGGEISARSYNVIQFWKDNPEVLPFLLM